ncbi:MAG TPA: asparaginase [Actinomycetes bacterium]|jgi:L-asparaginase|nr:asparaginase [Actinomycetes bacterium]
MGEQRTSATGDGVARVTVISLGGTIASAPAPGGTVASPRLSAEDLVAAVPELAGVASVVVRDLLRLPSCDLTLDHALAVAAEIRAAAAAGADGVVVTQGTDTIEEMSFCLDLLVHDDIALAVTGAMRHAGRTGNDGPANLLDAVRTVASPAARGLGCLVVLNEEVHAAPAVRKMHTSSPSAFRSPSTGPVGWIVEGQAHLRDRPIPRVLVRPLSGPLVRVPLVKLVIDDDGWWLPVVREAAAQGLVLEAMGGGHVPGWLCREIAELAARIPVILTSRTGDGEVLTSTYGGFKGSESWLIGAGLIPAGSLHALKARVLLGLLLSAGATRTQIEDAFALLGSPRRAGSAAGPTVIGTVDDGAVRTREGAGET